MKYFDSIGLGVDKKKMSTKIIILLLFAYFSKGTPHSSITENHDDSGEPKEVWDGFVGMYIITFFISINSL